MKVGSSKAWGRYRAQRLTGERISIVAIPALGGKVVSLLDRATSREWLVQRPPSRLRSPGPDSAWVSLDRSGWDECFPNIGPGWHPGPGYAGRPLREQGELWARRWHMAPSGDGLDLWSRGCAFPYRFHRRIRLAGSRVHIAYAVANEGREPLLAMWAMHPLLAIEPGTRVTGVPGRPRIDFATGIAARPGEHLDWPLAPRPDGPPLDVSVVPDPSAGVALKLFAPPPDQAVIVADDRGWLSFQADAGVTDLGLWLDYGGWPGTEDPSFHLAVEPSIGNADDLGVVARAGSGMVIPVGARESWSVTLQVGAADEPTPTTWRAAG